MAERVTDEDADLLAELGVEVELTEKDGRSAREQRIIAGFEEIERFYDEHKRLPQHGEGRDIFERLYAVRLDRLRTSEECLNVLRGFDSRGLLNTTSTQEKEPRDKAKTDQDLLVELGIDLAATDDVTQLKYVRPQSDRKAAEEIAQRTPCADFDQFHSLFDEVQQELTSGKRIAVRFQHNSKIETGDWFILEGQKVLVAELGEAFRQEFGREDRRLRVVYDNGTESNLLLRSLQRALYKDENGRRITPLDAQSVPLFAEEFAEDDKQVGTIYVLRSRSDHPFIVEHYELIHKIGVTGGDVKTRIANAKKDPTYLLAEVDVVAIYKLANVNRVKLEAVLKKIFQNARLDLELKDRFGTNVEPKEWFLVPLAAIDQAIELIKEGTIGNYHYDAKLAKMAINPSS